MRWFTSLCIHIYWGVGHACLICRLHWLSTLLQSDRTLPTESKHHLLARLPWNYLILHASLLEKSLVNQALLQGNWLDIWACLLQFGHCGRRRYCFKVRWHWIEQLVRLAARVYRLKWVFRKNALVGISSFLQSADINLWLLIAIISQLLFVFDGWHHLLCTWKSCNCHIVHCSTLWSRNWVVFSV